MVAVWKIPHHGALIGLADPKEVGIRLSQAMMKTHFKNVPTKPEEGKWTKTAPCADWGMLMQFPSALSETLVDDAFKTLRLGSDDSLHADLSSLNFNESSGVRADMAKEVTSDSMLKFAGRTLAVILTSTRPLTSFF